jgi:adenine-specific DNA-methyltransferase
MNLTESKLVISESDRNTVLQGDCIEAMRQFHSAIVDFVLTDPPYLVNYAFNDGRDAERRVAQFGIQRDLSLLRWNRADRFIAAWREAGFRIAGHLTFVKKYESRKRFLAYAHEYAYLLAKGSPSIPAQPISDVIEWEYTGNKLHPTQKPLCVLTPLIESFSLLGDIVLEPFCGSGSNASCCAAVRAAIPWH